MREAPLYRLWERDTLIQVMREEPLYGTVWAAAQTVPGYLAHKKQPPPLGPPYDPR